MVARPHGHALRVERGGQVVRMDAREVEGQDTRPDLRVPGAIDLEVLDLAEAGERLPDERRVVPADRLAAQALHVVDGRAQADRAGDGRRARLEPPREIVPGRAVEPDLADDLAAAEERLQRLQHLAPAVEHADAGGSPQLVPGERVEIGAERRHVDREVWRRLGAVEEHPGPRRLRALDDLRNRVDRAEHVRDVGERHEPGPPREEPLECLEVEGALVGHGHVPEPELPLPREEDPRHQVRVVLHLGQEDLVPRDERAPRPGVDDDVDRLRRPLREDDLLPLPGPEKRPDPVPRSLVELRRLLAQACGSSGGRWRSTARRRAATASRTGRGFWAVAAESR